MAVTKDTYDSFLQSVISKVPEAERGVVEQAFSHNAVAAELRDAVLARADYSRSQDSLTAAQSAFEAEVTEARQNIADWQDWYAKQVEVVAETESQLKEYRETYGDLEPTMNDDRGKRATHGHQAADSIDLDTLQSTLATRDQLAIKFADMLTDLKLDHQRDFNEKLDSTALMEYATKKGLPLDLAYRELVQPKVEEKRAIDLTKRIDEAREEGRRAALTEHKLPISPPHREMHVLERQGEVKKTSAERVAAAVARFNSGVSAR